jgi:hypothetical protein
MPELKVKVVHALDNLNTIIDADGLDLIVVEEGRFIIPEQRPAVELSAAKDPEAPELVKEAFGIMYSHLQNYYEKMRVQGKSQELMDAMNSAIVLVGEAAQKLDEWQGLFQGSVFELPEYKRLYNFYKNKVVHELYKDFSAPLKRGKLRHAKQKVLNLEGVHLLDDIEVVKKDYMYELFHMKNEQGHTFFTPKLESRIKLACDFDEFKGKYLGDDPLVQIKNWEDFALHQSAVHIVAQARDHIRRYYRQAMHYKEDSLVSLLNQSVMALMLAANASNLIRQFGHKPCYRYFNDFLGFLRETIRHRDFQKYLIYAPPAHTPFYSDVMDLVFKLTDLVFEGNLYYTEAEETLISWLNLKENEVLSKQIHNTYARLTKILKGHPSGPVFKAIDLIREKEIPPFDPILQGNLPQKDCEISWVGITSFDLVRMPAPIEQRSIHSAHIDEEFIVFLKSLERKESPKKMLWIGLDSTLHWQNEARAHVIQELSNKGEFSAHFNLMKVPVDTDFATQKGRYLSNDEYLLFKQTIFDIAEEGGAIYALPPRAKQEIIGDWLGEAVDLIHNHFFQGAESLSVDERVQFLGILNLFLELKTIEVTKPDIVVFGSKDGLDETAFQQAFMVAFIAIGHKRDWKNEELENFFKMLYGPTLMIRERAPLSESPHIMEELLKRLEKHPGYLSKANNLFGSPLDALSFHFYKR